MSKQFKIVLLIRFFGYALFLSGLITFTIIFGPIIQAEFNYRIDKFVGVKRTVSQAVQTPSPNPNDPKTQDSQDGFGDIQVEQLTIVPTSTKFGIVIPKINANADVVANVNAGSEKEYSQALYKGVAHAAGTNFPGEVGNTYLFSHSTDAPWNVVRFNAVFYLLRELEPGDSVVLFYNDRRYDYIVFDKQVVGANDVSFLTNIYNQPVLTLQTCDPPGTLFRRLVVRAKLAGS